MTEEIKTEARNVTPLRTKDSTDIHEYLQYKIETLVEEDELEEALAALAPFGLIRPYFYQVS